MGLETIYTGAGADAPICLNLSTSEAWEYARGGNHTMRAEEGIKQQLLAGIRSLLSEHTGGQLESGAQQYEERHLPVLMEMKSYDDFFDKAVFCPPEASPRTQARFKALKRHGNCRTRKAVIVRPEKYDPACDLTAAEWEILLKPLLHNPKLEELYILACTANISCEVKDKIYTVAGELLRTSESLKFLFLEMGGMSAGNVARLAQGLQGNFGSNLDAMIIIDRPSAGVMSHIWEMIERAPKLRHLWLKRIGALDGTGVNDWTEALRRSTSLVRLTLEGLEVGGVPELLFRAFTETEPCVNCSVTELELIEICGNPDGWKQLFDFLRPNTTLNCLELRDCKFLDTDEIFRNLMELLQVNFSLRKIKNDSIFSWKKDGKEALIDELLERNAKQMWQSTLS